MEIVREKYVLKIYHQHIQGVEIGEMLIQYRIDALAKFKEQHDERISLHHNFA